MDKPKVYLSLPRFGVTGALMRHCGCSFTGWFLCAGLAESFGMHRHGASIPPMMKVFKHKLDEHFLAKFSPVGSVQWRWRNNENPRAPREKQPSDSTAK